MKKQILLSLCIMSMGALYACGGDDDSGKPLTCNYQGSRCNKDGTALLYCDNGKEISYTCQCVANRCTNQPGTNQPGTNQPGTNQPGTNQPGTNQPGTNQPGTNQPGTNQPGTNQPGTNQPGTNQPGTNQPGNKVTCIYQGSKCNDLGTALLTCDGGTEKVKPCKCQNSMCVVDNTQKTCDYKVPKCNDDGTALLSCVEGIEYSQECECESGICWEDYLECNFEGKQCNKEGTALITCSDYEIVASETCVCQNNACPKTCVDGSQPVCSEDMHSRIYCEGGVPKSEPCGDNKICSNGTCVSSSTGSQCEFEDSCSVDFSGIRTCKSGVSGFEACENRFTCSYDQSGKPVCVSAMKGTDGCDEALFRPYCDGKMAYSCKSELLESQNCGKLNCVNGACVSDSGVALNDTCNEYFKEQCIGELPVYCATNKHVEVNTAGDCSQKGQICGVIKNSQIDSAECFDECQPGQVGTFRDICVAGSNIAYEHQEECVDIGYGRFGYLEVPGTFNQCPAGCTGGRCYDYTQDFDKYGQPCDLATANDSCLAEAMVAYCDNNQENPVYNVMVCTGNKICATVSLEGQIKASCNEQCTAGAEDRHICDVYGLGYASVTYHCTQQSSGKYAYVASESQFCDSARGCADDGRCK